MKPYFIFTKRGLAVMLALVILALIILGQFSTLNYSLYDGSTHRKRMEYLSLVGLRVNETAVAVKETVIPQEIDGNASKYNQIQQKAGFDLSKFCGKTATVYSYTLNDNPHKVVSVVVADGKIIAGDITDYLSGTIAPITKEN
ncbi:MAG: DUF4830 domain-containing protein [Ruminococcaceae bacterium]|nr:DUF4830 domain-containing protein [Oscillospiraceae bacterium]